MRIQMVKVVGTFLVVLGLVGCDKSASTTSSATDSPMLPQGNEENIQAESEATSMSDSNQTPTIQNSSDVSINTVDSTPDQTSQQIEDVNIVTDGPDATIGLAVNGYVVVRRTRTWPNSSSQLINTLDYDYSSNQIIVSKTYSNRNTEPVTQSLMTYDELGNWVGLEDLDMSSPFTLNREEYLYNNQGYLITSNSYLTSDGSQLTSRETNYLSDGRFDTQIKLLRTSLLKAEYDNNNQLAKITHYNDNSVNSSVSYSLTYDFTNNFPSEDEQLIRIASVNRQGNEWSGYDLFYFNDIGNLEIRESYNSDDTLSYTDEFSYELSPEPVFNYWLHHLWLTPFEMLYPFPRV